MINSKIKILFITYTQSNGGGAESLLTSYVNFFDSNKYEISILEVEHFDEKKEPLNKNINFKKIPCWYHNARKHLFYYYFSRINSKLLFSKPELLRALFSLKSFDFVISWNYQLPSFMLPAFSDCYRIGMFHGALYDLKGSDINICETKQLQKTVWDMADQIITISDNSFRSLRDVFPDFIEKTTIINNGIDFSYVKKRSEESTDIILNSDYKHLCCCGRMDKNKNFQLAIKALKIVEKKDDFVDLVIMGAGVLQDELLNLVKEYKLEKKVIFTGYQKNPYPIIKQCNIFCMTSFSEGFPMTVMESMSLGIPFVTTKVSGASEEMSYNQKCGLVADWDENDYADKLLQLLNNEQKYMQMKSECLNHIKDFSLESATSKFSKIFDNIENLKPSLKSGTLCKGKFLYFIKSLFEFDVTTFGNSKKEKLIYTIFYILSILLLPIKTLYIITYMILAML